MYSGLLVFAGLGLYHEICEGQKVPGWLKSRNKFVGFSGTVTKNHIYKYDASTKNDDLFFNDLVTSMNFFQSL